MKTTIITLCMLLCACTSRSDQKNEQKETVVSIDSSSPSDVVLGYFKAMEKEDSTTIINSLASGSKAELLPMIGKAGGFKMIFDQMKGTHYEVKVLKVDTLDSNRAKVYVNQNLDNGSTMHIKLDSLYYSVYKEDGVWKLLALNSKKD